MVDQTYAMRVRTGNWGNLPYLLSFHSDVEVELAPEDAPGGLVRIRHGVPSVPRELGAGEIVRLSVSTPSGHPILTVSPPEGAVERRPRQSVDGVWELRIEGLDQDTLILYARDGTPFPPEETLDRLAAVGKR